MKRTINTFFAKGLHFTTWSALENLIIREGVLYHPFHSKIDDVCRKLSNLECYSQDRINRLKEYL